jgi:hypothetical protein
VSEEDLNSGKGIFRTKILWANYGAGHRTFARWSLGLTTFEADDLCSDSRD